MLLRSEGGAANLADLRHTATPPSNIAAPVESAGYSSGVRREAHRLSRLDHGTADLDLDPPSMAALLEFTDQTALSSGCSARCSKTKVSLRQVGSRSSGVKDLGCAKLPLQQFRSQLVNKIDLSPIGVGLACVRCTLGMERTRRACLSTRASAVDGELGQSLLPRRVDPTASYFVRASSQRVAFRNECPE